MTFAMHYILAASNSLPVRELIMALLEPHVTNVKSMVCHVPSIFAYVFESDKEMDAMREATKRACDLTNAVTLETLDVSLYNVNYK